MAPIQEADSDNLGNSVRFSTQLLYVVYSLESPHRGDSNEFTQHTIS